MENVIWIIIGFLCRCVSCTFIYRLIHVSSFLQSGFTNEVQPGGPHAWLQLHPLGAVPTPRLPTTTQES